MAFEKDGVKISINEQNFFGRTVLKSSFDERELNQLNLITALKDVLPDHFKNRKEIDYLIGVYRGNQDILNKVKLIREDINNKVVENHAFQTVDFKKGYVFGDPIQYVQRGDSYKDEIDELNRIMLENDKQKKDIDLAEYFYIAGQAYRIVLPNSDPLKPVVFYTVNPKDAGVVYSTSFEGEPLFAFYLTPKMNHKTKAVYYIITVYTRQNIYIFQTSDIVSEFGFDKLQISYIKDEQPERETNFLGYIPIIEYPLNSNRMGIVELVLGSINALNKITSNDIDDIEQFVNSLLALFNVDISTDEYQKMVQSGAIKLVSSGDRSQQADLKMITNKLQHTETKVLYDRIYNNMLTIAGVPRMTEKSSSGDTGQARQIGEGWTMADERAKQDELAFKSSEKRFLEIVIGICERKPTTNIRNLRTSNIEIKFTRNKSDNILVKTQALMNLRNAGVEPYTAFNVIGLFSDSNAVVNACIAYYGEDFWKDISDNDVSNIVNENANTTES